MTTTRGITAGAARNKRWGILSGIDIGADGDPYLDRLRLLETPWFSVFLHHIHRPDKDPHPHDHPWAFASLVLCGGYVERVWPDKRNSRRTVTRRRPRWSPARLNRRAAHIITNIDGPLWTLVITGRSHGTDSWGFWVPAFEPVSRSSYFIPWREYVGANGLREYAAAKDAEGGEPRIPPESPVYRYLQSRRGGPAGGES